MTVTVKRRAVPTPIEEVEFLSESGKCRAVFVSSKTNHIGLGVRYDGTYVSVIMSLDDAKAFVQGALDFIHEVENQ